MYSASDHWQFTVHQLRGSRDPLRFPIDVCICHRPLTTDHCELAQKRREFACKSAQKHAPKPLLTCSWEILCEPLLLFGQFHGFTHQLNGQFQGICLEESQPLKRTFAGRAAPFERTFGRLNAPDKPTFRLIPLDLVGIPPFLIKKRSMEHPQVRAIPCLRIEAPGQPAG
jgi:hypothetical protein